MLIAISESAVNDPTTNQNVPRSETQRFTWRAIRVVEIFWTALVFELFYDFASLTAFGERTDLNRPQTISPFLINITILYSYCSWLPYLQWRSWGLHPCLLLRSLSLINQGMHFNYFVFYVGLRKKWIFSKRQMGTRGRCVSTHWAWQGMYLSAVLLQNA